MGLCFCYCLTDKQKEQIEAVAVDMWPAFANSIETNVPQAEIVHDRFHISKHLNDGVDKVRRQENKELVKNDDDRLKETKNSWLFNPENMSEGFNSRIQSIKSQARRVPRV